MCGVCHVSCFNCVSAVDVGGGGGSKSAPPFAVSHTQRLYQALVHTLRSCLSIMNMVSLTSTLHTQECAISLKYAHMHAPFLSPSLPLSLSGWPWSATVGGAGRLPWGGGGDSESLAERSGGGH